MVCDWSEKLSGIATKWLYTRWDIWLLSRPTIALVWPRKMSPYGKRILDVLFHEMQHYELVTVSGWAYWTDEYAHMLSLEYTIPTIIVLGWGIWWYKNTWKLHFLEKIVSLGGLVISEYDIFVAPQKYTFPQRNRIIAALWDIIFLPEAGLASGSLITVDKGIQYGKKIYAPMQDIFFSTSSGTNQYISQWKIMPLSWLQWFLDMHFALKPTAKRNPPTKKEISSDIPSVHTSLVQASLYELWL